VPTSAIFFLKGQVGAAIFMLIFYATLTFSVEYILKPWMVGGRVKMHTLVVFLSILGGLSVYGVLGIIYGPLIVTAFLSLADIYRDNYSEHVRTSKC
jgi:predicted PurR-regulated permease PerM